MVVELATELMPSIQCKEIHEKAPIEEDGDEEAEADEFLHQNGELELAEYFSDESWDLKVRVVPVDDKHAAQELKELQDTSDDVDASNRNIWYLLVKNGIMTLDCFPDANSKKGY